MRTVKVESTFEITGRGTVYCTVHPDPPYTVGEHVIVLGRRCTVTSIDTIGERTGQRTGLLCRPMSQL